MNHINKFILNFLLIFVFILMSQIYCDQADVYNNALSRYDIAPIPGNSGIITAANTKGTGLTLNWAKASDDKSAQSLLEYIVYVSINDDIDTIHRIKENGTPVCDWTADIDNIDVPALSELTIYYFNVIVKDEAEHEAAYTMMQVETTTNDFTSPIPGNGGVITTSDVKTDSISLSWTRANDDRTQEANLQYMIFISVTDSFSSAPNICTYEDAIANGFAINDWTNDINAIVANGLIQNAFYYINVFVRDEANNISAYNSVNEHTVPIAVYINNLSGSDDGSIGDGSYGAPYETIQKGISEAAAGSSV